MNIYPIAESAHAINGVPGRMYAIHAPQDARGRMVHRGQKWVSEGRTISANDWGHAAEIRVEIRFDDEFKNGHQTFAMTASIKNARGFEGVGMCHDEIAKVFPELAPLIKWHLVSTDGPLHYVENTMYHAKENGPTYAWVYYTGPNDALGLGDAKERLIGYLKTDKAKKAEGVAGYRLEWDKSTVKVRDLDAARNCGVWPDATDDELCAEPEVLKAALLARLPTLIAAFRADMDAAGMLWEPEQGE